MIPVDAATNPSSRHWVRRAIVITALLVGGQTTEQKANAVRVPLTQDLRASRSADCHTVQIDGTVPLEFGAPDTAYNIFRAINIGGGDFEPKADVSGWQPWIQQVGGNSVTLTNVPDGLFELDVTAVSTAGVEVLVGGIPIHACTSSDIAPVITVLSPTRARVSWSLPVSRPDVVYKYVVFVLLPDWVGWYEDPLTTSVEFDVPDTSPIGLAGMRIR